MNIKEMIQNSLFDKKWKKYVIIFTIVFLIVMGIGTYSITYLHNSIVDNHIHAEEIIVQNKGYDNNTYDNYYMIVDNNNKTYMVDNNNNNREIFDYIQIGKRYKVVIQEPDFMDLGNNNLPVIIQVYNDTR